MACVVHVVVNARLGRCDVAHEVNGIAGARGGTQCGDLSVLVVMRLMYSGIEEGSDGRPERSPSGSATAETRTRDAGRIKSVVRGGGDDPHPSNDRSRERGCEAVMDASARRAWRASDEKCSWLVARASSASSRRWSRFVYAGRMLVMRCAFGYTTRFVADAGETTPDMSLSKDIRLLCSAPEGGRAERRGGVRVHAVSLQPEFRDGR
mmetsp:Transcript_16038/g.53899  ORF Transcript_16038/g.53899 Transcript_16038/m.53899 type:complete len:208 (-) Transcript_16038:138-761(-)